MREERWFERSELHEVRVLPLKGRNFRPARRTFPIRWKCKFRYWGLLSAGIWKLLEWVTLVGCWAAGLEVALGESEAAEVVQRFGIALGFPAGGWVQE